MTTTQYYSRGLACAFEQQEPHKQHGFAHTEFYTTAGLSTMYVCDFCNNDYFNNLLREAENRVMELRANIIADPKGK